MQAKTTINPKALTFANWQMIAASCEKSNTWAFFRWLENSSELENVSRSEMKEIAEAVGRSVGWVMSKVDEHC